MFWPWQSPIQVLTRLFFKRSYIGISWPDVFQWVAWPSGLRRWFKAPVSSEAWVQIPPLPPFLPWKCVCVCEKNVCVLWPQPNNLIVFEVCQDGQAMLLHHNPQQSRQLPYMLTTFQTITTIRKGHHQPGSRGMVFFLPPCPLVAEMESPTIWKQ